MIDAGHGMALARQATVPGIVAISARHGLPEIVHTDQSSQFTGTEFIATLVRHNTPISLDGQGCRRELATYP
jgi:transposase InsO family protein